MDNNIRIEFDESALSMLERVQSLTVRQAADATLTDIKNAGVIPFDVGTMQDNQTYIDEVSPDNVQIVTEAEQAVRLYYHPEYNFTKTHNREAGAEWFRPWHDQRYKKSKFFAETYAELFRRNAGT